LTQPAFCYWLASCLLVTVFIVRDGRFSMTTMLPNKSPEPTAVGAVSSAVAVRVASRRWLSFFR
jgi:hypothetical protein